MKRSRKRLAAAGMVVFFIFFSMADVLGVTGNDIERDLHAKSALVMDGESKRVLYERNGYEKKANASTTKILTCILTLERMKEGQTATVSDYAASMPKVRLGVKKGQQFYMKDLLYSLMLESHNDAAVVIAEGISGDVQSFAKEMNHLAGKIGAVHTHFVTPNGLDAREHYTTAYDMALITQYALENPEFVELVNTREHSFTTVDGVSSYHVYNKNAFLTQYPGAIGVKTGFTGEAGYCFVGAVSYQGRTLISVVFASGWPPDKTWKWSDTRMLMDYVKDNFEKKKLLSKKKRLEYIEVKNGQQEYVRPVLESDYTTMLEKNSKVQYIYDVPQKLTAPVQKNEVIGKVQVYADETMIAEQPLYADWEVKERTYLFVLGNMAKQFLLR